MRTRRTLSILLVVAMLFSLLATVAPAVAADVENPYEPTQHVTHMGATFGRATAAYNYTTTSGGETVEVKVEGMPLFNGNPDDFAAYIDLILTEIDDEGIITLAGNRAPTGTYSGGTYTLPSGTPRTNEALMGAVGGTDLSTVMYQAQSWNKELIHDIGYLISSENKSTQVNNGYFWAMGNGASMTDMRLNPLSGRYDEGYGEDAVMASIFADLNARGYTGYEADETGFYLMSAVQTKHYTVYNAQWFRPLSSTQVGARSFYEYNAKSGNRGWADGTFSSIMSSYGRINGVPSSASFITHWAASLGPYAVYSQTDAGADTPYTTNTSAMNATYGEWGNGYDNVFAPDIYYKTAFMAASGHAPSGGSANVQYAIENGLNGLTMDDLLNVAVGWLTLRVRTGLYDERNADGTSKYYPFVEIAANGKEKVDYTSESSQAVALRNAQEGIVLLKNNGALPLSTSDKLGVYGPFAKAVNSGIYVVAVDDYTGRGEEAGYNALESIQKRAKDASFDLGLNQVTIQVGGCYLYVAADDTDGILLLKTEEEYKAAADKTGYYFGILDNGQGASSIYAYGNGRWLRAIISDPTTDFHAYVGSTTPLMNNTFMPESPFGAGWGTVDKPLVVADEDCAFKQRPNQGLPPMLSGYPYHFVLEDAGKDGEYYIRAGAKVNGVTFVAGVASIMDNYYGYYLEAQKYTPAEGEAYQTLGLGGATLGEDSFDGNGLKYFAGKADKANLTFKVTDVKDYGYAADAVTAAADDAAIIYVGQSYLGLSGEGTDRISLDLGASQIESALNIAKTYKEAGKKTVVVVYANYPVVVEKLQNSDDVDAILFAGYGGQYGGKATAQVLFGEYAPTGRLVSTWYKDTELFPKLDEYSVPQGTLGRGTADFWLNGLDLNDIDSRITVDMTAADVIGTGLTYKYLTDQQLKDHVTYPFGYGLSYSNFTLSNLKVGEQSGNTLTVTVNVTNSGDVKTSDVVQIYMAKVNSAYGDAAALKSLAGFEKVELAAGETKTVTVTIDLTDIAVWDVNAEDYVVESGAYVLCAAHDSSLKDALSEEITLTGADLAKLAINVENNIWEHSYDAEDVHFDEYSKLQTAAAAIADGVRDDIYAVTSKTTGAWVAIPNVDFTNVSSVTVTAGAPEGVNGKVELRLDAPDGEKVGEINVTATGEATLTLVASNPDAAKEIHEQGYNTITAAVTGASGVHNLYLVFRAKDLRVGTIKMNTFTDVDYSGYYADAVAWAVENGVDYGTTATTFNPNASISRAEAVFLLWQAAGSPEPLNTVNPFKDVKSYSYYSKAVLWAYANHYVVGSGAATFNPNGTITRAEIVTILNRVADNAKPSTTANPFVDVPSNSYYYNAVLWGVENGIVEGSSSTTFSPDGLCTRAHIVTYLWRDLAG